MTSQRSQLTDIARRVMKERGLEPDIPSAALAEAAAVADAPELADEPVRDLRSLLWCSIDNDDSRDLDQLSVSEKLAGGLVRVLVAVADVDVVVRKGSALDKHAAVNTTSVYTPAVIFPMLPERLSTDLTSLNADEDRLACVVELVVSGGKVTGSDVYGARVRNKSKLAYNSVDAWLTGTGGGLPSPAASVAGMDDQLRTQDSVAQALRRERVAAGALEFATREVSAQFDGDRLASLRPEVPNRAKQVIEEFMVAANGVVAKFLAAKGFPSIRRVVRTPKRWDRIVQLAAQTGDRLPSEPDSKALNQFLLVRKQADPERFPDLSLSVIKLLGSGEYVVDPPGGDAPGHFGLAVRDYGHSTAPNRRYPDLLTQRLIKAALEKQAAPYTMSELEYLAAHCTEQEDNAEKVERQVRKSAAALLVSTRVGQQFDAIVTGASPKGTYVRIQTPPVEGMLVHGQQGLDVGDRVHVRLSHVNVDRGFIDFTR